MNILKCKISKIQSILTKMFVKIAGMHIALRNT